MSPAEPLFLPADVVITPVADLDPATRRRLRADPGDCVISRPGSRHGSVVVDAAAAAFLGQFSEPKPFLRAVIDYSGASRSDPERVLDDSVPLVARLHRLRLLVSTADAEPSRSDPTISPGAQVAGVRAERCVHLFEDVELYRARDQHETPLALKILRPGASARSSAMLDREVSVLRLLGGAGAPALIATGQHQDRPYLLESWISGTGLASTAASMRAASSAGYTRELVALCEAVLAAYTGLHRRGVVHADVHPGNIVVGDRGTITLVDFGLASTAELATQAARPLRGAVPFYLDPQYCRALLAGSAPPPADEYSEQFALSALCFFLLTGAHYVEFQLAREDWLRQVAQPEPRSFAACGARPWPAVEAVLRRALRAEPDRRFSCVGELARRFAEAAGAAPVTADPGPSGPDGGGAALTELLWRRYGPDSDLALGDALPGPRCSVNYGASGLAYFFYRIACLRDDPRALSAADLWARWSVRHAGRSDAFHQAEINITADIVGPVSLYHSATGSWCVQALVCHAMGDLAGVRKAVRGYVLAADAPHEQMDLTLGGAGLLLGCTLLLEAFGTHPEVPAEALRELGGRTAERLAAHLVQAEPASGSAPIPWLGIAHGYAGMLYALLRWAQCAPAHIGPAGAALDEVLLAQLGRLRALGQPASGGISWPQGPGGRPHDARTWVGWCHGSAGYVPLWLEAHQRYGTHGFDSLAVAAGRHVWAAAPRLPDPGTLCCGSAGQSYALIALYRSTGDSVWLSRAMQLADRAVASASVGAARQRPGSLYKGDVGIALLAEELRQPELAAMPLFAAEGWPGTR